MQREANPRAKGRVHRLGRFVSILPPPGVKNLTLDGDTIDVLLVDEPASPGFLVPSRLVGG
jgi:hypothetical protein